MVSKRNFFSITIMMFVLLFLFQFSMVIRDRQNTYDVNSNFTTRQKGLGKTDMVEGFQVQRKMVKMSGKINR